MCLFHKYKEIKSGRAILERHKSDYQVKISIVKCTECGKERAYCIDQLGEKTKIAVWTAQDLISINT